MIVLWPDEPHRLQSAIRLDQPLPDRDHAPEEHYTREPRRGSDALDNDIRGNFEKNVWYEEYEQCDVVVIALHVEISRHALDLCIA